MDEFKWEAQKHYTSRVFEATLEASLLGYLRLPFTNNWRVAMENGAEDISDNCGSCTNNPQVGERIADYFYNAGTQVIYIF